MWPSDEAGASSRFVRKRLPSVICREPAAFTEAISVSLPQHHIRHPHDLAEAQYLGQAQRRGVGVPRAPDRDLPSLLHLPSDQRCDGTSKSATTERLQGVDADIHVLCRASRRAGQRHDGVVHDRSGGDGVREQFLGGPVFCASHLGGRSLEQFWYCSEAPAYRRRKPRLMAVLGTRRAKNSGGERLGRGKMVDYGPAQRPMGSLAHPGLLAGFLSGSPRFRVGGFGDSVPRPLGFFALEPKPQGMATRVSVVAGAPPAAAHLFASTGETNGCDVDSSPPRSSGREREQARAGTCFAPGSTWGWTCCLGSCPHKTATRHIH